jgi:hypothetical protein
MSAAKLSIRLKVLWAVLHLGTIGLPLLALIWGARWLDVLLPIINNFVLNFAPSLMLNKIIKPKIDLAGDYATAAAQAVRDRNGTQEQASASADVARIRHENEQEIVGHLCITIISICSLLASAFVLNVAYMITPPSIFITSRSNTTASTNPATPVWTNAVSSGAQVQPLAVTAFPIRRQVGTAVVIITTLVGLICIFHMVANTGHFVGKARYLRQDVADYSTCIWPPSIRCPLTYYRLVMTFLNSLLPVVKFCLS